MPHPFQHSAFRLEAVPDHGYSPTWLSHLRELQATGRTMSRVRVVRRPLTKYQRQQFTDIYPAHQEAGEDIRVLDITDHPDLDLPLRDFWLFDDNHVVLTQYRQGVPAGRATLTGADTAEYLRRKEVALAHSIPLADYRL
jgi:hypothetical protein